MAVLYVASSESLTGKTAICAGLGKQLLDKSRKVAYLKPALPDKVDDGDAAFMKRVLTLDEPLTDICPVIKDKNNLPNEIKEACDKVSSGKDVVIVENINELGIGEDSRKLAEALGAKVIIVEAYPKQVSKAIDSYKTWGVLLLGIVSNKVPKGQLEQVRNELLKQLNGTGINLLGVLPEDRVLFTLTVGELAENLKGKILNSTEKSSDVIENVMLGSMYVDSGLEYFGRRSDKAVIVKGERPDMQMAALETSTKCLVLTDNKKPIPAVLRKAEEKKVPLIQVKENLTATVTGIDGALGKSRFNQDGKLPHLMGIMTQHFNFAAVYQGLGLAG